MGYPNLNRYKVILDPLIGGFILLIFGVIALVGGVSLNLIILQYFALACLIISAMLILGSVM
jgi:membrane protein implicated in regulation of membrane protease activity